MDSVTLERLRELITGNTRIRSVLLTNGKAARDCDDTITALRELERRRELSGPMAPIAQVIVSEKPTGPHHVQRCILYAPGLPAGKHDLYPEPPQREPT